MGTNIGYKAGNKERTSNSSKGVSYSSGKDSSIARGISTGRAGASKIDVGYGAGKKEPNRSVSPDPKGGSVFKQGGRS